MSIENWIGIGILAGVFIVIFATMVYVGGWAVTIKTWLTAGAVVGLLIFALEMATAGGLA